MKVITNVVNNPIFIELQFKSLQKYLKNEFEFIVFNDAKDFPDYTNGGDITIKNKIEEKCKELGLKCITLENHSHMYNHSGSFRHSQVLANIIKYQLKNPDKYLLLDSDMLLVSYLDINKWSSFKSAIVLQQRNNNSCNYIWPGLCYLDMTEGNHFDVFNWDLTPTTDAGGMTEVWLKTQIQEGENFPTTENLRWNKETDYNTKKIYFIKHLWSLTWDESEYPEELKENKSLLTFIKTDLRNKDNKFFCEIYDNCFFHYRAGCNWLGEGMDFHKKHTLKLQELISSFK